jgi:Ca-activated chloride channel family protein
MQIPAKILLAVLTPVIFLAQNRPQALRVDVDLVSINVRVSDVRHDRHVLGLKAENFQLWEDRVLQKIEYFSAEEVPASIGIIYDISGSMGSSLADSRIAVSQLLKTGTVEDEYFLVTFNTKVNLESEFTRDSAKIQSKVTFVPAGGGTALYDAMYLGVEKVKKGRNLRKALVVITDGVDNSSRYTESDFAELMREQDVQIYQLNTAILARQSLEHETARISTALKNQYLIGYRSTNESRDGKWRSVRVRVNPLPGLPQLVVKAKEGYYGPSS